MEAILEKLQEFIEDEIQKKLLKYAQVISKKHDISLKLLIQDIPNKSDELSETGDEPKKSGQCLGITAKKLMCKSSGKHGGYCMRHKDQKKISLPKVESVDDINKHVGHTIKECMFLAGCPACERSRINSSRQNLLIDI